MVEDNSSVRAWSERLQSERGDSLAEGYISELQDFIRVNVVQNELQELRDIWASWDEGIKREVDLVPTIEEYTTLLRCPKIQVRKTYAQVFNSQAFVKKLMSISGMSEPWVTARIQQKGDSKCILWENLRDLILTHPDERKRNDIFALSIYGLVIFPKALRHVDEAVIDLFDCLEKGITSVPTILAETFRSLSSCRKTGEGRFIGCEQLLIVAIQRRENISEEKWIDIIQNLKEGDIEWRAYWIVSDDIMYQCGNFDWVSLLGIWGATGYTLLLALRQYKLRQFVPTTYGLAQSEFSFKGAHYKKKVRELSDAWKQICWIKRLAIDSMVTPEYDGWFKKRVNDNVPRLSLESARPMGEQLQVAPSELEIIREDFEKKSSKLGKKIEQLEEEKMHLRLDADVQRSEAEKWRKWKAKAEEDLNSLKADYKKLRLSMRTAGLGKSSE
ncbi:uncharacterized protein LOC108458924 [Gossypium arboreum]|uniref:uncharacterized protein LOC108458924 n=1 Tax=Gossypium arboreum TaxID=29729 RepID=UPI0022F19EEF|nr:uncharacterized protein LOC108458924 [Gossypium arboreum]